VSVAKNVDIRLGIALENTSFPSSSARLTAGDSRKRDLN
jgi:hypothetical protein